MSEPTRTRSSSWLALLFVVAIGFFVHRSALEHEFVSWDDDINLYENPNLIAGDIRWKLPWFEPYQGMWIPVTYTAWGAIAAATREEVGLDSYSLAPMPFHAASVALHLGSTALVFFLVRRWLESASGRRRTLAAVIGALVFSTHPMQVEAVHWATSMKDTLSVFLALCSLACAPTTPTKFGGRLLIAWLLFALALAAKPAVVVVPVVWLLLSFAHGKRPGRWTWIHFAVLLSLAGAAAVIARTAQPAGSGTDAATLLQRIWISIDSLGFYVVQVVAPASFCPDYGRTPAWVLEQGVTTPLLVGGAFLALLVVLAVRAKWNALAILLIFPAVLGPVLGLLPFSHQTFSTVTDRYAYLAMLVPALFLARVVAHPKLGLTWPFVLVLIGASGWSSIQLGRNWQDTQALWENVLRVNPKSGSAWTNLGYQHERAGRDEEAIEHYELAISVAPTNALAFNNIGNIHYRAGRIEEAHAAYSRARKANPRDLHARNNLGVIHHQRGELKEAEALFREVVETNPHFAPAHQNRGLVAVELGEFEQAEQHFREALRIDPGFARARRGLAVELARRGEDKDARSNLSRSLGQEVETPEFELGWSLVLQRAGRPIADIRGARTRAYELGWREPNFLEQLGLGLLYGDRTELSEEVLEDALTHGASGLEYRLALARIYRESERWDESRDLLVETVRDFSFEPGPWHGLALYHRHQGAVKQAKDAVRTALRLDPAHAPSRELADELGVVY